MNSGIAVLVVVLAAGALFGAGDWYGNATAKKACQLEKTQHLAGDAAAASQFAKVQREEERSRQQVADEEQKRATEELAKAHADFIRAQRAADGLQQQLTEIQRQYGHSETGRLSALAAASQTRGEATVLLARMLSESDQAAGEYAKEADRAFAAGRSCERFYDRVTNQPAPQ